MLPGRQDPWSVPEFSDMGTSSDPELELDFLQGSRIDETRNRLFNAVRTPPGGAPSSINVEALQALLGQQEADREGTFINRVQRPQVDASRTANFNASMEGFADPQEQAAYERSIEEEKMRIPLEQSRVAQQTGILQAQEQNRGAMERLQEEGRQTQELFGQVGTYDPRTGGYIPLPGGRTTWRAPRASAARGAGGMALDATSQRSLTAARRDLAQQEAAAQRRGPLSSAMGAVGSFFGMEPSVPEDTPALAASRAGLNQAIQNALIQLTPNPEIQQFASDLLNSPDWNTPLDDILAIQDPDFYMDPADIEQLRRILDILRLPLIQAQVPGQQ